MRVAFHWIASLSLPKKRQTHIFSSFCAKITPLRAAAIPKLVLSSTATAFIARLEKLNGWNRLKTIGGVTTQRKSDSARQCDVAFVKALLRRGASVRVLLIALIFVLASYCPAPAVSAKGSDEAEIKALEQRIADAANAKDPDAIMKNYLGGEGLFVFDVVPPRQYVGADAFHKDWEGFLGGFDGPITFENSDMTAESDARWRSCTT
jgi:hypothetical protein